MLWFSSQISRRAMLCLIIGLCTVAGIAGCSGGGGGSRTAEVVTPIPTPIPTPPPTPPSEPVLFHCSRDALCPEILVTGDPHASQSALPRFRGYGDPSLEFDPDSETLWLAYSWLDLLVSDPGPPAVLDLGARTHLAKSNDGGASFTFVREVNQANSEEHPDTLESGWGIHEVPTLVRESFDTWQMMWLKYFNPFGEPPPPASPLDRKAFMFQRSVASQPELLGDNIDLWARGTTTSPTWDTTLNLSSIDELTDCGTFSEPALFKHESGTYLAMWCLVFDASGRRLDLERNVLVKQESNGISYVGVILDADDAADLGVDTIAQADITFANDGKIILLATPIILGADPQHQGCIVFEFDNFQNASLLRDDDGVALPRVIITADGNGLGPGQCTYDTNSDTGVLLVTTTFADDNSDVEFSLRATGIHP